MLLPSAVIGAVADDIGRLLGVVEVTGVVVLALCALVVAGEVRSRLVRFEGDVFRVRAPPAHGSSEHFFMSLHGLRRSWVWRLLRGQPWVGVELVGRRGQVGLEVWIPRGREAFVSTLLRAVYPGTELDRDEELPTGLPSRAVGELRLTRGDLLPIRTSFTSEPMSSVISTLAEAGDRVDATLQLLVRPRGSRWQTRAHGRAQQLRDAGTGGPWRPLDGGAPRPRATQLDREHARAIETKAQGLGFECVLRVIVDAPSRREAEALVRSIAAALLPYSAANALALRSVRRAAARGGRYPARFPIGKGVLLTASELAALWHVPDDPAGHLEILRAPRIAPPADVESGERRVGTSIRGGREVPVRLSLADSRSHLHVLGSTGTGKTTLLLSLASQDITAGRGVAVLDPKGDLVSALLARIPLARAGDVVLIGPEDGGTSVGINPLELGPGDDRDLVAENALSIFKRVYERYWGPRTDDILKSALLTLLHLEGATLAHVPLLLTDDEYRRGALERLDDPLGLDGFWRWFEELSQSQRSESTGPVLNKLRDFLLRPRLRRLLCQARSTVDMREIVDGGKILLADLSVGRWGETTAALIGSFLVARIWQATLARAAQPEDRRRDFLLFMDEFQHFLGIAGPFSDALAEARGLRLSLTIANQHLGQLTRDLREAVASDARSRVVFQCGQDDAAYLAREFAPLDATALMSLGRFEAAARLAIAGRSSRPFTLRTVPPAGEPEPEAAAEIRATSARRWGRPNAEVDAEVRSSVAAPAVRATDQGWRRRRGHAEATSRAVGRVWVGPTAAGPSSARDPRKRAVTTSPEGPAPV